MDGYDFLRALRRLPGGDRAEGRVLHHRERCRAHRARDACRRRRIHHEAVRQGDRRGQVPGSRADLNPPRGPFACALRSHRVIAYERRPERAESNQPPRPTHPRDGGRRRRRGARPDARWLEARSRSAVVASLRPAARRSTRSSASTPMSWSSTSRCRSSTASRRCRCCSRKKRDLVVIMASSLTRRQAEVSCARCRSARRLHSEARYPIAASPTSPAFRTRADRQDPPHRRPAASAGAGAVARSRRRHRPPDASPRRMTRRAPPPPA